MTKALLFVTLLCCSAWVFAQSNDTSQSNSSSQTGSSTSSSTSTQQGSSDTGSSPQQGDVKIRGCVRQGNGDFEITDPETGTSYSLIGNSIDSHVGKDVEVMGMPTGTSGTTANSPSQTKTAGQSASENPFQVHSIRDLGECSGSQQH